ncbi:response regulator transcription factor [Ornithinimicrobium sp. W1679]|uniref:response regulator transcription factor n=1 Tax=Ornithinimicrobium sp. W1679 TaxID=3418770 RepID=UPI003CF96C4C
MTAARSEAGRRLAELLHRGLDIDGFFDAVDRTLAAAVQFDSSCWLGLDPSTLLPTSHFTREYGLEHLMSVAVNEFLEDDVNKFADLARAEVPVGLMNEATRGQPTLSKRYRDILSPHGYGQGDELRAVFFEGDSVWGCVALHRRHGSFTGREAQVVADLGARYIGEGIHRALLVTTLRAGAGSDVPGLILVAPDNSIESVTPGARRMLGEIIDSTIRPTGLPLVLNSLVARVRATGAAGRGDVATTRVPRRAGGWYVLYGSALGVAQEGRVSVMVYPESVPEIPAAVAVAYSLSPREQEVSALVLQGCSTREISDRLHLSQYTVQDHLKTIFTKVGVHSRRELVAQIFREHYAPRLSRPDTSPQPSPTPHARTSSPADP